MNRRVLNLLCAVMLAWTFLSEVVCAQNGGVPLWTNFLDASAIGGIAVDHSGKVFVVGCNTDLYLSDGGREVSVPSF